MIVIKTYITVTDEKNRRIELKFRDKMPTQEEIQKAYEDVIKPVPELNQCPMNNPKCPLYREAK